MSTHLLQQIQPLQDLDIGTIFKILNNCKKPYNIIIMKNDHYKLNESTFTGYIGFLLRKGLITHIVKIVEYKRVSHYVITDKGMEILEQIESLYNMLREW